MKVKRGERIIKARSSQVLVRAIHESTLQKNQQSLIQFIALQLEVFKTKMIRGKFIFALRSLQIVNDSEQK